MKEIQKDDIGPMHEPVECPNPSAKQMDVALLESRYQIVSILCIRYTGIFCCVYVDLMQQRRTEPMHFDYAPIILCTYLEGNSK